MFLYWLLFIKPWKKLFITVWLITEWISIGVSSNMFGSHWGGIWFEFWLESSCPVFLPGLSQHVGIVPSSWQLLLPSRSLLNKFHSPTMYVTQVHMYWLLMMLQQVGLWGWRLSQQYHWRFRCSGIWCCVTGWVVPGVSEDHSAFIFRVKQCKAKVLQLFEMSGTDHPTILHLISGDFHLKANWIVLWQ